ncbi:MAG: YraN family protein [Deltaproteobacteria bacterium]|nr:YraN family protein [Deltaproteobacteria bacterium]
MAFARFTGVPSFARSTNSTLGAYAEEIAAHILKDRGYLIIERNYRSPVGEIDIIARNERDIVFIEVKGRRSQQFGNPEEAVSPAKQRKLIKTAEGYLSGKGLIDQPARFDVVSIIFDSKGDPVIDIIKNAFPAGLR